jgi:hypothetical protein
MSVPARFVHVGIHAAGEVPIAALETLFGTALDWVRYDPHCWILYTNSELNVWRDHLRKILPVGNAFFLCEFSVVPDRTYSGYLKQDIWDWITKAR